MTTDERILIGILRRPRPIPINDVTSSYINNGYIKVREGGCKCGGKKYEITESGRQFVAGLITKNNFESKIKRCITCGNVTNNFNTDGQFICGVCNVR